MALLAASGAANSLNFGLSSSGTFSDTDYLIIFKLCYGFFVDMEDADSSTASAPALNPLAATAAVLMASQQQQQQAQQQQQQHHKATKANKDLLEKSVAVAAAAAECEFAGADFSDDDDDDDEDDDDDDDGNFIEIGFTYQYYFH